MEELLNRPAPHHQRRFFKELQTEPHNQQDGTVRGNVRLAGQGQQQGEQDKQAQLRGAKEPGQEDAAAAGAASAA
jgi:hypothetical protein